MNHDSKHPVLGVGIILLRNNKVLLGRRLGPRNPGEFGLPGGFLEKMETFEGCARRELDEETGLNGFDLYPVSSVRWGEGQDYYFDFIFCAESLVGEPVVKEKDRTESWDWFEINNLPAPLYQPTRLALEKFINTQISGKLNTLLRKIVFRRRKVIWFED
ncbi:MAG: NUDIX hydrolase [Anaerolineales bacterium]|nr:NUDIX hydrolase [Anaerolineales bacterium]